MGVQGERLCSLDLAPKYVNHRMDLKSVAYCAFSPLLVALLSLVFVLWTVLLREMAAAGGWRCCTTYDVCLLCPGLGRREHAESCGSERHPSFISPLADPRRSYERTL